MKNSSQSSVKTILVFTIFMVCIQFLSAKTITKNYTVNEFNKIKVGSAFQVEFIHSNENKVIVEIDESASQNILVVNEGNILTIKLKEYSESNAQTMKAKVYGNTLSGIFLGGASHFTSDYVFNGKETNVKASGASKMDISLKTDNLNIDISGASKISIKGSTEKQVIDISGASFYEGKNCKSSTTFINASGASKATVISTDTLDATASGASKIIYTGTPKTLHKNSSGASDIETADE